VKVTFQILSHNISEKCKENIKSRAIMADVMRELTWFLYTSGGHDKYYPQGYETVFGSHQEF
jgi:hypothetical protein